MVATATTIFESRPGGDNYNSGGFDPTITGAGTDYSQQDTYQLALSDLACIAGSTTITSASGSFYADLVGNTIYIRTGTNFTAGIYVINGFMDANTITVNSSPSPSANGSAGTGNIGGAWKAPNNTTWNFLVPGNRLWVKSGNYTITANVTPSSAGTGIAEIIIEGYKTTRGDAPEGDDRPKYIGGAYGVYVPAFAIVRHIDTSSASNNATLGVNSTGGAAFVNCKAINTSSSTGKYAFYNSYGNATYIDCEGKSTLGTAFNTFGSRLISCKGHDSSIGFNLNNFPTAIIDCISSGNTTGLISTGAGVTILDSIFYSNTTHVNLNTQKHPVIMNSIFHTGTSGIIDSTLNYSSGIRYNIFYNITNNISNITTLDSTNKLNTDPMFTDPANGDFTLRSGSPAIAAASGFGRIGLIGDYKRNIGIDQDNNLSQHSAVGFIRFS